METKNTSFIKENKNIIFIALGTLLLLAVPFLAMTFNLNVPEPGGSTSDKADWSLGDFILMGTLIFGTGLVLNLILTKVTNWTHRVVFGIVALAVFFYIWAELAVGIFLNFGS